MPIATLVSQWWRWWEWGLSLGGSGRNRPAHLEAVSFSFCFKLSIYTLLPAACLHLPATICHMEDGGCLHHAPSGKMELNSLLHCMQIGVFLHNSSTIQAGDSDSGDGHSGICPHQLFFLPAPTVSSLPSFLQILLSPFPFISFPN